MNPTPGVTIRWCRYELYPEQIKGCGTEIPHDARHRTSPGNAIKTKITPPEQKKPLNHVNRFMKCKDGNVSSEGPKLQNGHGLLLKTASQKQSQEQYIKLWTIMP